MLLAVQQKLHRLYEATKGYSDSPAQNYRWIYTKFIETKHAVKMFIEESLG